MSWHFSINQNGVPSFHLDSSPKETPAPTPHETSGAPSPHPKSPTQQQSSGDTPLPPPPPTACAATSAAGEIDEKIEKAAAPPTAASGASLGEAEAAAVEQRRDTLFVSTSVDSGAASTQVEIDEAEMESRQAESLVDMEDLAADGGAGGGEGGGGEKGDEPVGAKAEDDRDAELERLADVSLLRILLFFSIL